MPSYAVIMMPERSAASDSVKPAAIADPAESEIATLAYRLWQDNGCPVGSDKENWFRAEAMLKNALVAKRQDLSGRLPVPRSDTGTEFEMLAVFQWEGHWVVWENEWGGARWVWGLGHSGVEVLNRAA